MSEQEEILQQIQVQLTTLSDYGQLQIHVKKHGGEYSNTDYVKMTTVRYTDDDPNVTCTSDVFKLIKNIANTALTGTLSFTIQFKKGRADIMQVQDFRKL